MKQIQILIIEDNRLVRDGLCALLAEHQDFTVVGAEETAGDGMLQVQKMLPHVVLLDAGLGVNGSHDLVVELRRRAPDAKVIVMDLLPSREDVIDFIQAGANGFIMKDATTEDFVATIRAVAGGTGVVPATLTNTLLTHIADHAANRSLPDAAAAVRMTRREREVIERIAEGLSNKEIAQQLNLAPYTVKSHVHNILEKLALHSRLQIAAHVHRVASEVPRNTQTT